MYTCRLVGVVTEDICCYIGSDQTLHQYPNLYHNIITAASCQLDVSCGNETRTSLIPSATEAGWGDRFSMSPGSKSWQYHWVFTCSTRFTSGYYSYLIFLPYHQAKYEYTIRPTTWTEYNTNRILSAGLPLVPVTWQLLVTVNKMQNTEHTCLHRHFLSCNHFCRYITSVNSIGTWYRCWPKVSVSIVSVNSGIGPTLVWTNKWTSKMEMEIQTT